MTSECSRARHGHHVPPGDARRRSRRTARAVLVVGGLVAGLAAMAAPATAAPETAAAVTWTPVITVSKTAGLLLDGETLTVTGTGFDPAAHVGTRAPLSGQPSGFYVVFGRFADPWQPSAGAPSAARQVIAQKWALPAASRALLDPKGTSEDIVTIAADGTFSTTIDVKPAAGTGRYGIATFAGSGAVDATQETLTPVSFAAPPVDTGTGTGNGTGAAGQSLVVTPMANLDPAGQDIEVKGSGYDPTVGIYVALCVDQGASAAPSPCVGGAESGGKESAWISSNPPPYASGLTTPFGAGGSFAVRLHVKAADELVDCFAAGTRCVVATRADHTAGANRSADVKVPVYFTGQQPPADPADPPADPDPSIVIDRSEVAQGGTVAIQASGFLAGEQVQVWLHSTPQVIGVVDASAAGTISARVTIPAAAEPGVHHLELVGVTSGRTAASADFTVVAAAVEAAATTITTTTTTTVIPVRAAGVTATPTAVATGTLPATGPASSGPLGAAGLTMVAAGALLVMASRRRLVPPPATSSSPPPASPSCSDTTRDLP